MATTLVCEQIQSSLSLLSYRDWIQSHKRWPRRRTRLASDLGDLGAWHSTMPRNPQQTAPLKPLRPKVHRTPLIRQLAKADFSASVLPKRGLQLQKRNASELSFRNSSNQLPTVEVNLDSIPSGQNFSSNLVEALRSCTKADPSLRCTVYVYVGPSVNFLQPTSSAFIAPVGGQTTLESIRHYFSKVDGVQVRFSDYISTDQGMRQAHVEDGRIWQPYEAGVWYSNDLTVEGSEPEEELDDQLIDFDEIDFDEDDEFYGNASDSDDSDNERDDREATVKARRFRAARSDASVGSITRQIERVFGLPEGSVALCGPDRKALRRDARIATLRRRWD